MIVLYWLSYPRLVTLGEPERDGKLITETLGLTPRCKLGKKLTAIQVHEKMPGQWTSGHWGVPWCPEIKLPFTNKHRKNGAQ